MNKIFSKFAIGLASFALIVGGASAAISYNYEKPVYAEPAGSVTISGPNDDFVFTEGEINLTAQSNDYSEDNFVWSSSDSYIASVQGSGSNARVTGQHKGEVEITVSVVINNETVASDSYSLRVLKFGLEPKARRLEMIPNTTRRVYFDCIDAIGPIDFSTVDTSESVTSEVKHDDARNSYYVEITAGDVDGLDVFVTVNALNPCGYDGSHYAKFNVDVKIREHYAIGGKVQNLPGKNDEILVYLSNEANTKFYYVDPNYSGDPQLKVTNNFNQASVFALNNSSWLRCCLQNFYSGNERYIFGKELYENVGGAYGAYYTTRDSYANEEDFARDCPKFITYPGLLCSGYAMSYLGIDPYGKPGLSKISYLDTNIIHCEPVYMYYAVSHGPTITPDQTDIILMENETADIGITVSYINTLNCEVISGNECIKNATVSYIDGWNQTHLTIQATATPGTAVVRLTVPFIGQYADINVTVKAKPETLVRNLTTQTSLAYRYEKDNEGNFSYDDITIRFGAEISKDLWNELDELYGITSFGVLIADGDYYADKNISDMISLTGTNYPFNDQGSRISVGDPSIHECFVRINDMEGIIGVTEDSYFWNLRLELFNNDYDYTPNTSFTAAAFIALGEDDNREYIIMNQTSCSLVSLAKDYLDNRGCDENTAGGSLKYIVDTWGY